MEKIVFLFIFILYSYSSAIDWSTFEEDFCEFQEHSIRVNVKCVDFNISTDDVKTLFETSHDAITNDENTGLSMENCVLSDFNADQAHKISQSRTWSFRNCSISLKTQGQNKNSKITGMTLSNVNFTGKTRTNALKSFANLKFYQCYSCQYPSTRIHNQFFPKENINHIKIAGSNLNSIDEDSFSDMINMELFYIEYSPLQFVSENCCKNLPKLKVVRLKGNKLLTVGSNVFTGMPALEDLIITYNNLEVIKENMFTNNKKINSLDFSHNKLNYIQENSFIGLRYLRQLYLSHNNLTNVDLYALYEIDYLDLSNNNLQTVPDFSQLRKLKNLFLQNNKLKIVYTPWFLPPSILDFDISDNEEIIFNDKDYLKLYDMRYFKMDNTKMLKFERKCMDGNYLPICDSVNIEVEWN